jgi:hypothetical protein
MRPRYAVAGLSFGLVLVLIWGTACSRTPEKKAKKEEEKRENQMDAALDALRRATTVGGYREGLNLVGANIDATQRTSLELPPKTRALLKERFLLGDDELKEVESATFQPLDAFHLEFCYRLRDAKKLLEQAGLSALDQATRCFDWVARQVILRESTDDLLPPQATLRLGFGTAKERALIFLAVLHQFQMDGCIVALPGSAATVPDPLVVGVVLDQNKKTDIYLFDPRLGRALPGPGGKGVASLADVRKHPELLAPGDGAAVAKGEVEVYLAPPLQALSRRMKLLEELVTDRHRVRLAHEPDTLLARVEEAAGGKVRVWHGPAPAVTPLRALRAYLPTAEGGSDKTRRMEFTKLQLTSGAAEARDVYKRMRLLGPNELVPEANQHLVELTDQLFKKYSEGARDFLLRGQTAQVHQRLGLILKPLTELDLDALEPQRVLKWRSDLNRAYLEGPNQVEAAWRADLYFRSLLDGRADVGFKEIKDLTMIALRAVRKPLSRDIFYLQALTEHEEAAQAQARRQAGGKTGKAGFTAQWVEARNAWQKYISTYAVAPSDIEPRLQVLRFWAKNRDLESLENLLYGTSNLISDLHKGMTARFHLALAWDAAGQRGEAIKELKTLLDQVAAVDKTELAKDYADFAAVMRGTPLGRALGTLSKDFGSDGGFAWLGRAARLQLQDWAGKN